MKNPKNTNRKTKDLEVALNDLDIAFWVDNDKNYYLWHDEFKCTTKEAWEIVDKEMGGRKFKRKKKGASQQRGGHYSLDETASPKLPSQIGWAIEQFARSKNEAIETALKKCGVSEDDVGDVEIRERNDGAAIYFRGNAIGQIRCGIFNTEEGGLELKAEFILFNGGLPNGE